MVGEPKLTIGDVPRVYLFMNAQTLLNGGEQHIAHNTLSAQGILRMKRANGCGSMLLVTPRLQENISVAEGITAIMFPEYYGKMRF
jgi:hypothetical protein